MISCPLELQLPLRAAVVEEASGVLRHDLRNKLASIRNSLFYIRKRTEKNTTLLVDDPRAKQFFSLIETELEACNDLLSAKHPKPADAKHRAGDLGQRCAKFVRSLAVPTNVSIEVASVQGQLPHAEVDDLELQMALFCLIENATEALEAAGGGTMFVRCVGEEGMSRIEISNAAPEGDPSKMMVAFFSTKPGRLGVGLNVAKRAAVRWGGKLELTRREGNVVASLTFPAIGRVAP